jgi:hypothetical protein
VAITQTTRVGLNIYGAGTDSFTRAQVNADHTVIENTMAIDLQGLAIDRVPAAKRGRWFYATDTGAFSRDTGAEWILLPALPTANTWTAKQTISSNTQPQLYIETATATAAAQEIRRRRTASDGSTYTEVLSEVTANVSRWLPRKNGTTGITTDFSGMEGRWSINWGADTAPDETFVIKARGGSEIARFTEAGFVGVGQNAPSYRLDVKAAATSIPAMRVGATGQDYALVVTPRGSNRVTFTSGAEISSSTSTARTTSAGQFDVNGATFAFFGDTGLTTGNTYTPTKRFELDSAGAAKALDSYWGTGALGAASPYVRVWSPDSNRGFVTAAKTGSNTTTLNLEAVGSTAAVNLMPASYVAGTFFRQSSGDLIAAFPGWTASGTATPIGDNQDGTNYPAYRLARITDITDGSGHVQSVHGLGGSDHILSVDSWVFAPDGTAWKMNTTAWNGTRVYAEHASYPNRRMVHCVMFAQTSVIIS